MIYSSETEKTSPRSISKAWLLGGTNLKSYSYGTLEKVSPCLGHFEESKTAAILARDGITPAQRAMLEEFRAIAGKKNWDFATLRESLLWLNRQHAMGGCGWAQSDANMAAKLLQSADPIPQRPEIFIVNRQSPNVLIKLNGMPQASFCLLHAARDARVAGKIESDQWQLWDVSLAPAAEWLPHSPHPRIRLRIGDWSRVFLPAKKRSEGVTYAAKPAIRYT
jgi:hypothetical protein